MPLLADDETAPMLQLHYFPGNASLIPHLVLEELGVPFELKYVDRAVSAHKSPEYLAMNPNGLIPVLVDLVRRRGGQAAGAVRDRRGLHAPGRHASGRRSDAAARHRPSAPRPTSGSPG